MVRVLHLLHAHHSKMSTQRTMQRLCVVLDDVFGFAYWTETVVRDEYKGFSAWLEYSEDLLEETAPTHDMFQDLRSNNYIKGRVRERDRWEKAVMHVDAFGAQPLDGVL